MSRLIIENRSAVNDADTLSYVAAVIRAGRISNDGKQYCYCTKFKDGTMVSTDLNKSSDRFIVWDYKGETPNG